MTLVFAMLLAIACLPVGSELSDSWDAQGGPTTMATERTLTIEEYDDDSELPPDHNTPQQVDAPPAYDAATAVTPLIDVKEAVGRLLVPSYLPAGFELVESSYSGETSKIAYANEHGLMLFVTQNPHGGTFRVKRGQVDSISVGEWEGYLIRGVMTRAVSNDNIAGPASWDADLSLAVVVKVDDTWVRIDAVPEPVQRGLTEAGLLRIAGSLTYF